MITEVPWRSALLGGMLIGLSATLLLAFGGKIAGISGMVNGVLTGSKSEQWRWFFLVGMLAGGGIYEYGLAPQPTPVSTFAPVAMMLGGFFVGFGTRMGNGCTSGHGVCGLGRLSVRSLVAVLTFMGTAFLTVFIIRHLLTI